MYRFYLVAVDTLPGALILLPVYLVLNKVYFRNIEKSIIYYLLSCYLSAIFVVVGLPNITYIRPELNLNLIPIAGMLHDWKNSILNVILFIPLGLVLPILWQKYRHVHTAMLFGFGISLAIELLQMLTFRTTDINDLITNTIGTCLGFFVTKKLWVQFPNLVQRIQEEHTRGLRILLVTVFSVMFFLYPFVSSTMWNFIL